MILGLTMTRNWPPQTKEHIKLVQWTISSVWRDLWHTKPTNHCLRMAVTKHFSFNLQCVAYCKGKMIYIVQHRNWRLHQNIITPMQRYVECPKYINILMQTFGLHYKYPSPLWKCNFWKCWNCAHLHRIGKFRFHVQEKDPAWRPQGLLSAYRVKRLLTTTVLAENAQDHYNVHPLTPLGKCKQIVYWFIAFL